MVRDISSATQAEKNAEQNIPIDLYQIYLPDTTLYWALWSNSLDFYDEDGNPQTYDPAALTRRPINRSKGMDVDRYELQLDNVGQEWSAYASNYDLSGVKVAIWKVFLERTYHETTESTSDTWEEVFDLSSSWQYLDQRWEDIINQEESVTSYYTYEVKSDFADRIPLFTGYIANPQITEKQIKVQVKSSLDTLDKRLPGRLFASKCQWTFGSAECGITPPTNSGTIQSMNASQDIITLQSLSSTNWIHGSLETGDYIRMIKDYDASANTVTLEFPLPSDVAVGDTYTATAGCSKVKNDSVKGCDFWGNKPFFGGFPELPEIQNIRQ